MVEPKETKLIRIDAELHAQLQCLSDFEERTMKKVAERFIRQGLYGDATKDETED